MAELSLTVDGLEKERDFYFGKLRDIEVICQDAGGEENPTLKKILEVLYATEVSQKKKFIANNHLYLKPLDSWKLKSIFFRLNSLTRMVVYQLG